MPLPKIQTVKLSEFRSVRHFGDGRMRELAKCSHCRRLKPVEQFEGETVCRPCRFKFRDSQFSSSPLFNTELADFLCRIFRQARGGAVTRSLPFALAERDLFDLYFGQMGLCALSGRRMSYHRATKRGERIGSNISVDRIDSRYGYTRDNCQLVCVRINLMKGTMTSEEFRLWCAAVVLHNAEDDEE